MGRTLRVRRLVGAFLYRTGQFRRYRLSTTGASVDKCYIGCVYYDGWEGRRGGTVQGRLGSHSCVSFFFLVNHVIGWIL